MMQVPCYLAPSMIEGIGAFTRVAIRKGDVVWRFDGRFDRLIPEADFHAAPEHFKEFLMRYCYPAPSYPGFFVLESDEGRYINHSDAPNTDYRFEDCGRAMRDIAAGEELTCDYGHFLSGEIEWMPPRHLEE